MKKGQSLPWPQKAKDKIALLKLQKIVAAAELAGDIMTGAGAAFIQKHQALPGIRFYVFSRLVHLDPSSHPVVKPSGIWVAKPAGMWGAESLDQALEGATRQYPPGERVLLRLDFVLGDPSPK
jgi:hypothetical protein